MREREREREGGREREEFSARKISVSFFHYCWVFMIRCAVEVKNQTVQTGSGAHPAANSVETEDSFPG
jgi:hypothetical protein